MTASPLPENGLELAGPDLRAQVAVLRRRWPIVLAVTAIALGAAAGITFGRTPLHRAETKLILAQSSGATVLPASTFGRTVRDLVKSNIVAQNVIQDLRLTVSADELLDRVSVVADPASSVLTIRADDPSRTRAQQIAQEVALVFAQLVKQRLAEASTDPARVVTGPTATVFDPAHALPGQVSPDVARDLAIGAAIGVLLGLLIAFLADHLDRRLRDPDAVAAAFGLPVLGTIRRAPRRRGVVDGDMDGQAALRAALQLLALRRPLRTLLIAGVDGSAPSATVAAGLAGAFSRAGARVVLVEGDVRAPGLADQLGLGSPAPGLSEVLWGASLESALRTAFIDGGTEIDVLLGGTPAEGAEADRLSGEAMANLADQLAAMHDAVLLVAPSFAAGAAGLELARLADGVLIVCRGGATTADAAAALRARLAGLGVEPVGVVIADGAAPAPAGKGGGPRLPRLPKPGLPGLPGRS